MTEKSTKPQNSSTQALSRYNRTTALIWVGAFLLSGINTLLLVVRLL